MKKLIYYIIYLMMVLAGSIAMVSCYDRLDYPDGDIEPGESTFNVEVGFKAFTPALDTRAAGDAVKRIKTLWLVFYDKDGNYIRKQEISDFDQEGLDDNNRPDGQPSSESQTGYVRFKLTVDNGRYRIYAVANHDLTDIDVSTIEKLKNVDLTWDSDIEKFNKQDPPCNAQMFGWFVNGDKNTDHESDAPIVTINGNNTLIHAWMRRAISKVTLAFRTDKLSDDVRIYLKSVTIKDIPKHCYLGAQNMPGDQNYQLSSELVDGETIYFGNAQESQTGKADHDKWERIHTGDSIYGLYSNVHGLPERGMTISERLNREHSDVAPALYFYENMQGTGIEGTETDKRQDVNGNNTEVTYPDGTDPNNKAWKDGMKFGSYIEVKGYYENTGDETPGRGDIIYRFMLGKDVTTDYNAERNYHYKLTMTFNHNANDVDFHIDYKEEAKPGLLVQDTAFVSYLYNQESYTTVRATPRIGYELLSMKAYIVANEWIPYEMDAALDLYNARAWRKQQEQKESYVSNAGGYTRPTSSYNPTWKDFNGTVHPTSAEKPAYKESGNTEFGFLSLRKTTRQMYELGGSGTKTTFVAAMRKLYFLGDKNGKGTMDNSRGYRDYGTMPSTDGTTPVNDATNGDYSITRTYNPRARTTDYVVKVPLFTRAKSIDSWAVYSGANPFYKHRRYAKILFIAKYKKVDTNVAGPSEYEEAGLTNVLQARRVDNPRVIYRRHDNKQSFNVLLCYNSLTAEEQIYGSDPGDAEIYKPVLSNGAWSVSIERDDHNLVSLTANGKTITKGGTLTGHNNTPIQFTYTPLKDATESKAFGAIITVRYHNNTCTHKIIVRQGYAASQIGNEGPMWSVFNVYNGSELTKSPLAIGSTFRRTGNLSYPIAESNNYRKGYGVDEAIPGGLKILGIDDDVVWSSIPANTSASGSDFGSPNMSLKNYAYVDAESGKNGKSFVYRLPAYTELRYIGIYSKKDNIDNIETSEEYPYVEDRGQAFGIAYADGATHTLLTKDAYSYYDPNNEGKDTSKGVRGVAIYSLSTGDNIFFSFGSLGNPRRRRGGLLQYASIDFKLNRDNASDDYRPLAYDLRTQVGGCYWLSPSNSTTHVAIDYNGGNYMSSYLNHGDVFQTNNTDADALPIKPVRK